MTRNRKRYAVLGTLFLLAVAGIAYALLHPTVTVRLTRDEIQSRIDARMPLHLVKYGVAYDVQKAAVDLRTDGRIVVKADVDASALGRTAKVALGGNGIVAYRDGAFYLTKFRVDNADPRAVDPGPADEAKPKGWYEGATEAPTLRDRAARVLGVAGAEDAAGFLAAKKLAVIRLAKEKGEAMLANALETRPVYVLKDGDFRQSLAKLALRDVRVENGELVVELNVLAAATRILLYVLGGVLACAIVLFVLGTGGGAGLAALLTLGLVAQ